MCGQSDVSPLAVADAASANCNWRAGTGPVHSRLRACPTIFGRAPCGGNFFFEVASRDPIVTRTPDYSHRLLDLFVEFLKAIPGLKPTIRVASASTTFESSESVSPRAMLNWALAGRDIST